MKKLILFVAALAVSATVMSAQEVHTGLGTKSLAAFGTYSMNSDFEFRSGVMFNYFVADNLALRGNVRLGYAGDKVDNEDTSWKNSNEVVLGLGIQKYIVETKRVCGYVGADAVAGLIGDKSIHKSGENFYTNLDRTFEVGLRPVMGLEYHFVSDFFIGAEWGYEMLFNKETSKRNAAGIVESNNVSRNTILNVCDLSCVTVRVGFCF